MVKPITVSQPRLSVMMSVYAPGQSCVAFPLPWPVMVPGPQTNS